MTDQELIAIATEHARKFEESPNLPASLDALPTIRVQQAVVIYFESPNRDQYIQISLDRNTGDFISACYVPPGPRVGAKSQ
jgi:hypothetical protein